MTLTGSKSEESAGVAAAILLSRKFMQVRSDTISLAAPLSAEDQQVQSMEDASPTKWHLGHTTWFFDAMVLDKFAEPAGNEGLHYLFNSYYNALGPQHARRERGLITRPSCSEVSSYRAQVDAAIQMFLASANEADLSAAAPIIELGLNHEQQHQELILMDIKHLFYANPLHPAYGAAALQTVKVAGQVSASDWQHYPAQICDIGAAGDLFAFDNEGPRHRVWSEAFRLRSGLVTCGEWLEFMEDGGYRRPELWLSDGWDLARREDWSAPLYWSSAADGVWSIFTLRGDRAVCPDEPVCHVSYYEADAFARWANARLPTEAEWERAAQGRHHADGFSLHPVAARSVQVLAQMSGSVWQWTSSAYAPYPGFRPAPGAAAEYNGKFMSGQMVLRGGACVTPQGHTRPTYRNFFPPSARWAFSGVRLATDN